MIAKRFNDQVESGNGNMTLGFKKLELNDRLPSIFKCRVQLFEGWFDGWSDEEREQLLSRIKNLDGEFTEKLERSIETGKLPTNSLHEPLYDISDEIYEALRKNHQLTNGNSLNSISSIDLLNTSNTSNTSNGSSTNENGLMSESMNNGLTNGHSTAYQNGHSTANGGPSSNGLEEEDNEDEEPNNEDSMPNQNSSLEPDSVPNGDESIESESNNENL